MALHETCDPRNPNLCNPLILGLTSLDHPIIQNFIHLKLKSFSTTVHQENTHFIHGTSLWFDLELLTLNALVSPMELTQNHPTRHQAQFSIKI